MRKTKHIRRRDMDRVISSVAEHRKVPRTLPTGGAIYAHHYTGKVHYVAQGGYFGDPRIDVAHRWNRSHGRRGHRFGRHRAAMRAADKARIVADKAKAAAKEAEKGYSKRVVREARESGGEPSDYEMPYERQMRVDKGKPKWLRGEPIA